MVEKKKWSTWERAVPIKQPDHIKSSEYSEQVPFKPSYEQINEPVSMFKLIAMDYARQWHEEKKQLKEIIITAKEQPYLQRRYVIRGLLRKLVVTQIEEKRFIMKRFMNIPSRYKSEKQTPKIIPKKVEEDNESSDKSVSIVTPCSSYTNLLSLDGKETSDQSTPTSCSSSCHKNSCGCVTIKGI
ncbi:hypothetical protein O3M35_005135 [Rhynocoris fuscipes]|uniref:Uncharacterized protein n=1 Tax=Rhynocoris fuscipes TaxID=488301 RepID=A0AAW1DJI1_9HEMI